MRLRTASATDPGLEREENEDSVVVWRNKAGLDSLLIVCDGMGGHAAGQTASSIAVKTFAAVLAEDGDEGPDLNRLKRACKQANSAVFDAARKNPEWAGMGSTLVVAAIRGGDLGLGRPDNGTTAVARAEVDITATATLPRLKRISQLQKGGN